MIRKIFVPKTDAVRSNLEYCIMRIGCDMTGYKPKNQKHLKLFVQQFAGY
jgi:hypothetical protein